MAVAPSDPNIIYVGSGEGLQRPDLSVGDGMYKIDRRRQDLAPSRPARRAADSRRSWSTRSNPNRLFVAVLGHPYGPNAERGVFRSTDGGQTFQKVLYKDEHTGAIDLAFDPAQSADRLRRALAGAPGPLGERRILRARTAACSSPPMAAILGTQLTGGLPTFAQGLGRIGIGDRAQRPQPHVRAGGSRARPAASTAPTMPATTWRRVNSEKRIYGRGSDFACVRVDPKNQDVIYVANTSTYRSDRCRPDLHRHQGRARRRRLSHHLDQPQAIPTSSCWRCDQGATISVNYGRTWSSWYNQPTAQFYHVITDNQFPYWVYGGQQESGSAGIASRGNDGADHLPRMASRGRRRVRLHRARPAPSRTSFTAAAWARQAARHPLRPRHRRGGARRARSGNYRHLRTLPGAVFARSIRTFSTWARRWC